MIRSEKLCEGNLSTSLLEGKLVLMQLSQIAKTVQLFGLKKVEKRHAGTWLSRSPLTKIGNCRYAWLIRPCITRETRVSSLVVDSGPCYHPCSIQEMKTEMAVRIDKSSTPEETETKEQKKNW